jgi:aminoglycoside phosphotransferase (APT) family kinase protein
MNPPGLEREPLARWLATTLPNLLHDGYWKAELIAGGLSNVTYRIHFSETTVVLRRPPLGTILPRAHDMAREYRILKALSDGPIPVPVPMAICTDTSVLGAIFYVMSDVSGSVLRTSESTDHLDEPQRFQLSEALIDTLIQLHSLDPDEVGLGDYGRRSGYCRRQVATWGNQWMRSRTRELSDMEDLLSVLDDTAPEDSASAIVHGDYRLDNTMFDLTGRPQLVAVLDWELSTLGDPLADFGLMLTYWHDIGDEERALIPVGAGLTSKAGFPRSSELAEVYAVRTNQDLSNLPFYLALGAMKLAVILEGVHARFLGGQTVGPGYDGAQQAVPILAASGLRSLRGGLR